MELMSIIVVGVLLAFGIEMLLAGQSREVISDRFFLFGLGLSLGLLSLNVISKVAWRLIRFSETSLIHPGSAALLGQIIVVVIMVFVQAYLTAKVRVTSASFLRGAVLSQIIVIVHSPDLGLSWLCVAALFVLSLLFAGYHALLRFGWGRRKSK